MTYSAVYSTPEQGHTGATKSYDDDMAAYNVATHLPMLYASMIDSLEVAFTEEEISIAITNTSSGKSPRLDRYTPCSIKMFSSLLLPFLTNSLATRANFPFQSLKAHISLIPKPDNDHSIFSIYRPISLIGFDLNMYVKAITNRLQPLLPCLNHLKQVGLLREARDNTLKTILLIDYDCLHIIFLGLLSLKIRNCCPLNRYCRFRPSYGFHKCVAILLIFS